MSVGKVFFTQRAAPLTLTRLVEQKKLGKKSGGGFYVWQEGKPQKPALETHELPPDLQDRLILPLVNEAVAVRREQVVDDADLIDAGAIFGAGFAPFRGGPLQYAKNRGVSAVIARLRELEQRYGERFRPDSGWQLLL
jgi:3-hydroxyacyl-CoA dehydrogenase/enoyl-CoA hydratase/3-hydroxybutyryl-CoA epimerase